MQVIPVINCPDLACVKEKLVQLHDFLPPHEWIHLDVTDGEFSTHATWAAPGEWASLGVTFSLEVHLMVRRPEEYIGAWLAAGAKRIIVHVESLDRERAEAMVAIVKNHGAEIMLAMDPETPVEATEPYHDLFSAYQILAVHPGPGSQIFMPPALEKISTLRKKFPNAIIEIDGGVNPSVARAVKNAGASVVTSDHFLWSAENPKNAYEELKNI